MVFRNLEWENTGINIDKLIDILSRIDFTKKYRILISPKDENIELLLSIAQTRLSARTKLLMFIESLEGRVALDKFSIRVANREGKTIFRGEDFIPEKKYNIVSTPEIWMGIKAWIGKREEKRWLLITALDRTVPIPIYKYDGNLYIWIFRKNGNSVEYSVETAPTLDDAKKCAREYVNKDLGAWAEIIITCGGGAVYEVLTKIENDKIDEYKNVKWIKSNNLTLDDLFFEYDGMGHYKEFYIYLKDSIYIRQYKYVHPKALINQPSNNSYNHFYLFFGNFV